MKVLINYRSCRLDVFCKKVFLKFGKTHRKASVPKSLFYYKVAGLRPWRKCFLVKFAKILRTSIFIEHLWWLLLQLWNAHEVIGYVPTEQKFTCSKLTIETLEQGVKYVHVFSPCSGVSIVNFEHVIAGWLQGPLDRGTRKDLWFSSSND